MEIQPYTHGIGLEGLNSPSDSTRAGRSRREAARFDLTRPSAKQDKQRDLFRDDKPEPVHVGFGSGSVSLPGLTITALKRNLSEAQKLVPTIVESEDWVRERIAEDKARLERLSNPEPPRFLDVRVGADDAAGHARTIINGLNSTAGQALTRAGLGASQAPDRVSVQIGDIQLPVIRDSSRPRLDVLA